MTNAERGETRRSKLAEKSETEAVQAERAKVDGSMQA